MKRDWGWVYEELRDLQRADADDLRREAEEEAAQLVPRPEPPVPADEVVDLGLIPFEDALERVRRTNPPPPRRAHRTRRI